MNILVIGNGGREHAIIWKLRQEPEVEKIYCTIGNAGINEISTPVPIKPDNISSLLDFAEKNQIGLTVTGPETPLSLGIVDEFCSKGHKIFGPSQNAAKLETSKSFAKGFMKKYGIPSAAFQEYNISQKAEALKFLESHKYPLVVKADGLAAGKGVIICRSPEDARNALAEIFDKKVFGAAGDKIIIEDFLAGSEASVFAVSDGNNYIILPPAQDHKKILEGEKGKNTGGMGSFAPADKIVNDAIMEKVKSRIIEPVLKNMRDEGNEFKGCLYCGLMIDETGDPYVIEFNARFGDPETQVVLPLIKSGFFELLLRSAEGSLDKYRLEIKNEYYCSVVLASKGYPDDYEKGKVITGLSSVDSGCIVFHAGTGLNENNEIISTGGRVLNVVGCSGKNLREAIDRAYANTGKINFSNKYFRTDIGLKGLN